uniref:Pentatricopeptide repeat-containing protein At1g30610, chloroplastic n=1 Tax=Anthurium amnicola TaxID=1678845 RepID=A0A1D1YMK8_9ARAE
MTRANYQMGTLRLEADGHLCGSARGFAVSPKPIFGVILNLGSGNRFRGLGICAPGRRATTVLASGGAGARSITEAVLEEELKFLPAFGDYVKVLQSIQTDRRKHPSLDSDSSRFKCRPAGKEGSRKARDKGNGKFVDPRMSSHNTRVHTDRILENYLDGEQFTHEREGKYSRDEMDQELDSDETKRGGWGLVEDTPEKSGPWKTGDKSGGKVKNLRNVSEHSLNSIIKGEHSRSLEKRQSNYFDDVSKRKNNSKQNGKHGRNYQLHERQTHGRLRGGRSAIQKVGPNSLGRKVSGFDIGDLENVGKLYGGKDFLVKSFQGKMGEFETTKSLLKKGSTFTGKSDSSLIESEFTKMPERDRFYETEMGTKNDKSRIHVSPLRRDNSPTRIDEPGVLEMESGKVHRSICLHDMEMDATNHCGHSTQLTALDNSKENNKEGRNHGHDVVMKKKFASKISKSDETTGSINVRGDKVAGRHVGDFDLDDRAAFKTFEVFTDVKNRPRILRMELEERIHNLAKRLNSTDVNMPEWQFSRMMHGAKIKFTDHSILRVVQILGAFGNWRRVLQVVEWLESRERFKSYKSRYIYTTVLSVLGKAKRPMEALNVFFAMHQELSSYPDLAAYHCIAVILGQAGLMKELFDVIDCMRAIPEKKFKLGVLQRWDPCLEPDLVVYNAVLNACVQQKQWNGAFWVLQELKQRGIRPSSTTYGLVMEVMLACGKYNLVHEFFRKAQKNSIPGTLNYKVLVNTFWREGKIDEAVLAVKDMERVGIVGSASLYYDLARCLCSAGRCEEALLQIDKLCKVAQKPLVVTYTGLIQTCLDCGSIHNATYIFDQMHKCCYPNVVTCNIMLKSYVEHGMFQEAKYLFQTILEGNKCINKRSDLIGKVVPDKFMFNTVMEACVDTKHWDDFEYVYQQMFHYGYHFDAKRHLHMVMEASRAGKVQVLDTTCEHLICSGRTPPPAIVKERVCLRLQDGDCVAALSCLDIDEPGQLQAYSEKSWLNILETNLTRFGEDVLIRLAYEINKLPSVSCQKRPMLQNLFTACEKIINLRENAIDHSCNQQTLSHDV